MGDHTTDARNQAEAMRAAISVISFQANQMLTQLSQMQERVQELGGQVLALGTHNLDVANAASLMTNQIPEELQQTSRRLVLVVNTLEEYADKV